MRKLLTALIILLATTACTRKVSYLSVVVPQGEVFNGYELNYASVRKNVTATDTNLIFLFFPFGHPKFSTAVNKAIIDGKGNVMTNVTVIEEMNWYILFGTNRIEVTGDVVNTTVVQLRDKSRVL
jgi:hypothetical protein